MREIERQQELYRALLRLTTTGRELANDDLSLMLLFLCRRH
jgi:hypothetical protein